MGRISSDNVHGLCLATSSGIFIGTSFIVKKKGFLKATYQKKKKGFLKAGITGTKAGSGGYSYLLEPWWWAGMITMIVGERADFAAYAYAPAILATPLGALSIIFSAFLAHFILAEKLHIFGNQVMSVKAVGIALKLTFSGTNQFIYVQTRFFILFVIICCLLQVNYLNKALDTFNIAVISPVYYVMFTSLTIILSMIMFKDWDSQNASQIATELCGFVTILCGTFLLHKTKDVGDDEAMEPSQFTTRVLNPNSSSRRTEIFTNISLKVLDEYRSCSSS
ncbi:hypothetical protein F0562_035224 [Nyssa sinensis]|uniref:Probable magnesium transporter n=1 Tax=Nyssa sinensis TaxID=561372 RepID=A0A5J5AEP6_9ASTE|nr:hypothetical protein F0562_035224 [Nyssa sinensis]